MTINKHHAAEAGQPWDLRSTPSFGLNLPLQQTEIGLQYTYGLYYYQKTAG